MTMQCLMSTLPKHRRLRRRRNIYTIFFFFGVSSQLNLSCTSSEFQSAYTLALDSEDAAAQFNLGTMYDHGDGVEQSEEIAHAWYRKSADQGHKGSKAKMIAKYLRHIRKAAEGGDAVAQVKLGMLHKTGEVVAQSDTEAVRWFKAAADQGDAEGQFRLGSMYLMGQGGLESSAKAYELYAKSSAQGHADGGKAAEMMVEYGLVPDDGVLEESPGGSDVGSGDASSEALGVPATLEGWMETAEQGDAEAQFKVGSMYLKGLGVNQSLPTALRWFRKSAAGGNVHGQIMLGMMYENGSGVKRSYGEAYAFFTVASANDGDAVQAAGPGGSPQHLVESGVCSPACVAKGLQLAKAIRETVDRGGGEAFRDKLLAFYAARSPDGLPKVDDLVDKYMFDQATIFEMLERKYEAYAAATRKEDL